MDRDLRRKMVYELTHLTENKIRLEQLRLDLIDKGNRPSAPLPPDGSRSNLPSDPTCDEAIRTISILECIKKLDLKIKKIELALDALPIKQRRIIELRYIDKACYTKEEVIAILSCKDRYMSRSRYYINRNDAIDKLIYIIGKEVLKNWK